MRFNMHKLFNPLVMPFLNLAYISKFSEWRNKNNKPPFNDFFLSNWDYNKRYKLYEFLLGHEKLENTPVNYLEFGVFEGSSFKWWLEHNKAEDSRFYGFDTFEGLPEAWDQFKAGDMTTHGKMPQINDARGTFIKGLFQDTLPSFLTKLDNSKRKIIHLDADLYSSTLYVLTKMDEYIKPGDIIIFDEFGVPTHEFLAFHNYISAYGRELELVAAANNYFFTAFKVTK